MINDVDEMNFDSDVCVCFHVSARKLYHYARRERPAHFSQMTECLGAGTGCQSCVPLLRTIAAMSSSVDPPALVSALTAQLAARDAARARRTNQSPPPDAPPPPSANC